MANYQGPGVVRAAFRLAQGGPLTAYSAPEAVGPGTNFSTRTNTRHFQASWGNPL